MFDLIPWREKKGRRNGNGAVAARGTFEPFARMRDEFDRLFENFFDDLPAQWQRGRGWNLDVEDKDDKILVRAEAPGFEPGDFDLQVRGDQLVMKAEHKAEKEEQGMRSWQRQEFFRVVPLPAATNPDKVDARYKNGVLTITLPKTEKAVGKKIAIKE